MSKGAYDIFAFVNFFCGSIGNQNKHTTIGLFETSNTFGHALAKDLIELLYKYDLKKINHCLKK
jgi:hypothetical protein